MQEGVASEAARSPATSGSASSPSSTTTTTSSWRGRPRWRFSEDVGKRFEAYGWHVQDLEEDLSVEQHRGAIDAAGAVPDRPSLMILRTHIGYGSPNKQDTSLGARLAAGRGRGEGARRRAMAGPADKTSSCPTRRASRSRRPPSAAAEPWRSGRSGSPPSGRPTPDTAAELDLHEAAGLPDGWDADLPIFSPDDGASPPARHRSQVIQWAATQACRT